MIWRGKPATGRMDKSNIVQKEGRTFPIASNPLSKKKSMPRKRKSTPRAVRATPISANQKMNDLSGWAKLLPRQQWLLLMSYFSLLLSSSMFYRPLIRHTTDENVKLNLTCAVQRPQIPLLSSDPISLKVKKS